MSKGTGVRSIAVALCLATCAACANDSDRSILASSVQYATQKDSAAIRRGQTGIVTMDADPGIVLPVASRLTITLLERNAAWFHALYVVSGAEELLVAGPGYLFPGPTFDVGPYGPGTVALRLLSYDPWPPHSLIGVGAARVTGSYPNWIVYFEDSFDGDFDDIIVGVRATPSSAELRVECTASVVRGEEVKCTASVDPVTATLEVQKWKFNGGEYERQQTTSETEWKGTGVVSGTVEVTALVDGVEQTKQTSYSVTPRDFSGLVPKFTVTEEKQNHLPEKPDSVADLGDVHFGRAAFDVSKVAFDTKGPNQLIAYLTGIPFEWTARVHANRTALSRGSDFYRAQRAGAPVYDASGMCTRSDVEPFLKVVLAHEGLNMEDKSHTALYEKKLKELAGPAIESVTGSSHSEVAERAVRALESVETAAMAESDLADSKYPPRYCTFSYTYPR